MVKKSLRKSRRHWGQGRRRREMKKGSASDIWAEIPLKTMWRPSEACCVESTMTEKVCRLQHIIEQVDIPWRQLQPMEDFCWRKCILNYYSSGNSSYQGEKVWEVRNNRGQLLWTDLRPSFPHPCAQLEKSGRQQRHLNMKEWSGAWKKQGAA